MCIACACDMWVQAGACLVTGWYTHHYRLNLLSVPRACHRACMPSCISSCMHAIVHVIVHARHRARTPSCIVPFMAGPCNTPCTASCIASCNAPCIASNCIQLHRALHQGTWPCLHLRRSRHLLSHGVLLVGLGPVSHLEVRVWGCGQNMVAGGKGGAWGFRSLQ